MKKTIIIIAAAFICMSAAAQTPAALVAAVKNAQKNTRWAVYTIKRTDTLMTGDIRSMSGNVFMKPDANDSVLGFQFRAALDGDYHEKIYDGHLGYLIDHNHKTFTSVPDADRINYLIFGGGAGWLVMPDLIKVDTAKAIGFELTKDNNNYYLKIKYADFKPEDVTRRYKILTINRKSMLPAAMRSHQETLGKVQDLYYHIEDIRVNGSGDA
ncbi:hypothetical protein SAMN05216464_10864 [Mucilaginibacter pineti]|uniref:Outer membrane lipoprotein-sorting protein n=1 Tax=Mucilaginibacter pineti TaxID=1391627 RepID=A0A1G7EK14_9SPHI|nr:hypothetical protein [Mucilaginibacter pineti]SDE64039.1 hypothetical protein SAMN05216464_10864 [Mucilaginibacter pineti]